MQREEGEEKELAGERGVGVERDTCTLFWDDVEVTLQVVVVQGGRGKGGSRRPRFVLENLALAHGLFSLLLMALLVLT